jgi:hypothetical protein
MLMIFEGNTKFREKFIKFWIAVHRIGFECFSLTVLQGYRITGLQIYRVTVFEEFQC